jgi:hypothetical protein
MSTVHEEFAAVLLRQRIVSREQLDEVRQACRQTGARLERLLVAFGYATQEQILGAWAEVLGLALLDLRELTLPQSVIELMPESVARENIVLPVAMIGQVLTVVMAEADPDVLQKLEFIMNRTIRPVLAPREQVIEAINRHYGQCETESVDSMLCTFTDTAIDFTRTEAAGGCDFELELAESGQPAPHPLLERRATVRYYHRMNPERMFPLLVVLSRQGVREVAKRGVSQGQSKQFQVEEGSLVEVEPILPGCACYPPREQVRIGPGEATVTFWVVPHVLGRVMQARVVVRRQGATLAEVPLQMRVVKQTLTVLMGTFSLVLPFVLLLLKYFNLDFESQMKEDFGLYARLAGWLIHALTPEVLTGLLLAGTAGLYLWLRPRKRDVFWDVSPVVADEPPASEVPSAPPAGEMRAVDYFRASLEAYKAGDPRRALGILEQARASLPAARMKGPLWYNMGCFAARLGRFGEALDYLERAVDAGYADPDKYRGDPDLEALRWNPRFKRLLRELDSTMQRLQ